MINYDLWTSRYQQVSIDIIYQTPQFNFGLSYQDKEPILTAEELKTIVMLQRLSAV